MHRLPVWVKWAEASALPVVMRACRFRDLVGGKNVKKERAKEAGKAARRLAFEVALAGGLYLAWSRVFP